jgi:hypothetical protein
MNSIWPPHYSSWLLATTDLPSSWEEFINIPFVRLQRYLQPHTTHKPETIKYSLVSPVAYSTVSSTGKLSLNRMPAWATQLLQCQLPQAEWQHEVEAYTAWGTSNFSDHSNQPAWRYHPTPYCCVPIRQIFWRLGHLKLNSTGTMFPKNTWIRACM